MTSITQIKGNEMLTAALWYAQKKGWAVIPLHSIKNGACTCGKRNCDNPGKHPRFDKNLIPNGLKSATTDPERIREWWNRWPDANIGIVTGAKSGFVALDIDPPEGEESMTDLEQQHGAIPDTVENITGSGGRHILFRCPDWYVPNSVGKNGGIAPGLDIRGDGGYIIVPPSVHSSGNRYEWEALHHPTETELAEIPRWLADKIRTKVTRKSKETKAKITGRIWEKFLQGGSIPDGSRDDTLFSIGATMRTYGADHADILATLTAINAERCQPPLDWRQVLQKADQAAKFAPGKSGLLHFPATDWGNAERLADRHGADLKYCAKLNGWHIWDGKRWSLDETGEVFRRAAETVRAYRREAEKQLEEIEKQLEQAPPNKQEELEKQKKAAQTVAKFAKQSEFKARITAMIDLAQNLPGIPITTEQLDRTPWAINLNNGTLDLKTGEIRKHQREDMITKLAPVDYDPTAECPRWLGFLDRIMDGDKEMIEYLQRAAGYALTGDTGEQVMFFLYGAGANGKSVFLNTLQDLMGDYAQQAPTSLLMAKQSDGVPNDVARLKGARFVATIETEEGKRMAEALVKQLTGGDTITARFLRQEFFEFKPEGKVFLASNHKPLIRGTDYAIWRRIHLIPFMVQIPPEERDKRLPEKLREELAGILKWAVDGLKQWHQQGLNPPEKVLAATEEYKGEMDGIGAFIEDCCIEHWEARATVADMYRTYAEWCDENGERPMNKRMFGKRMAERGYEQTRTGRARYWDGIGLISIFPDQTQKTGGDISDKSDINSGITYKTKPNQFQNVSYPQSNVTNVTYVTGGGSVDEVAPTREKTQERRRGRL